MIRRKRKEGKRQRRVRWLTSERRPKGSEGRSRQRNRSSAAPRSGSVQRVLGWGKSTVGLQRNWWRETCGTVRRGRAAPGRVASAQDVQEVYILFLNKMGEDFDMFWTQDWNDPTYLLTGSFHLLGWGNTVKWGRAVEARRPIKIGLQTRNGLEEEMAVAEMVKSGQILDLFQR